MQDIIKWLSENWLTTIVALVAIAEIIVNITPTKKDNSILLMLKEFVNLFITNNAKGGGEFVTQSRHTERKKKRLKN